jgi:hypothetical protein
MTKALVIHASGKYEVVDRELNLQALQGAVGGWIEPVRLGRDAILWDDEEGKIKGKPENELATLLAHSRGALWPNDVIVGDVIITGLEPPGDDDMRSVPDWVPEQVERMAAALAVAGEHLP